MYVYIHVMCNLKAMPVTLFGAGSELLPEVSRVTFSTLGACLGYSFGYMLLPLSAYFIRGWRMLLVVSALLSFLQVPTWW